MLGVEQLYPTLHWDLSGPGTPHCLRQGMEHAVNVCHAPRTCRHSWSSQRQVKQAGSPHFKNERTEIQRSYLLVICSRSFSWQMTGPVFKSMLWQKHHQPNFKSTIYVSMIMLKKKRVFYLLPSARHLILLQGKRTLLFLRKQALPLTQVAAAW